MSAPDALGLLAAQWSAHLDIPITADDVAIMLRMHRKLAEAPEAAPVDFSDI